MNKKTAIQTAIFLSLFAGQVSAAETFSPAYIAQVDSNASFVRTTTADIVTPVVEMTQTLAALRPDNGNLALVWQEGTNNSASTKQSGVGHVGLIRQIGMDNVASIQQSGSGHQALIFQQGRGNQAFIAQR